LSTIHADEKTVSELLKGQKYGIDEYQREYAWETKHIEELLDDLYTRFNDCYEESHARADVDRYNGYYLGAVIVSRRDGKDYVVDGQQRLTSLTLLLIYLHHLQRDNVTANATDVEDLICSTKFGQRSFNIDIPERAECLEKLLASGDTAITSNGDDSVANMLARYADIQEKFPDELKGAALPYFVDWLLEKVMLVQIATDSDDDAYIIFETMNDRGKSLSPTDMLKGYLLSQVSTPEKRTRLNLRWREYMAKLCAANREEGADFVKHWLRAKYAKTIRERRKNAKAQDFDLIGTTFHRWVRDHHADIGLERPEQFELLLRDTFPRYADEYLRIREAERTLKQGWEAVFYNANNSFTLQYPLLLAPIVPGDDAATAERKIRVVATYLDIYIARRAVNYLSLNYSTIVYAMFLLMNEIRDLGLDELVQVLRSKLDAWDVTFEGAGDWRTGVAGFGLNQWSKRYIHHILARLTAHIEVASGIPNHFREYVNLEHGKPYEIEHLWANIYSRYAGFGLSQDDFSRTRNQVAALVLVPRRDNQSYGALPYEDKVRHYLSQNLLARSLHAQCYDHNPSFTSFVRASGLPFAPYATLTPVELGQRAELYLELCKRVWSPERLVEAAR
jgi:uncharacterized protein with ParB-like and HNH nuclease domain